MLTARFCGSGGEYHHPSGEQIDKRLWKHYLPAVVVAGGNYVYFPQAHR